MYILNSKSRWPLSGTSRIAERFYFNLCKTFQLNWGPPQRFDPICQRTREPNAK